MTEGQIFPMTSGEGYGAVIHGNFVIVRTAFRGFGAHVAAYQLDRNSQYQTFDSVADAVAWAVAAAATHQGEPNQLAKTEYWEIHNGYSIAINRTDADGYQPDTFPMWVDSDDYPVIRNIEVFSTRDEAIQWARQWVDELIRQQANYEQRLREIREALEAPSSQAPFPAQ